MYSPSQGDDIFNKYLEKGFGKSEDKNKKDKFNIVATVNAKICTEEEKEDNLKLARNVYTLYVGGMGAKDKNFYFNLVCDYGYEEEANQIQELYLSGKKDKAEAIFPTELLDDLTLVGTKEEIKEKFKVWKNSNVTELSIGLPVDLETIRYLKSLNEET